MQVFSGLQKLGMCMNKKSTNRKIKEAAQHFQKKVKSWKQSQYHLKINRYSFNYFFVEYIYKCLFFLEA